MPRPFITEKQKTEMRARIRRAAIRVVRKQRLTPGDLRGYQRITIREITEEADISVGTFYKYFKNRDDLAQSLWAPPVEKLRQEMQADFESTEEPREQIRGLLEHYIRFSVENREIFRGAFLLVRPEGDAIPNPAKLQDEVLYENLCRAFTAGQASGEFRDFDVHRMAQVFWASIHGSLALPVNLDRYDFDPPVELAGDVIENLLYSISKH